MTKVMIVQIPFFKCIKQQFVQTKIFNNSIIIAHRITK